MSNVKFKNPKLLGKLEIIKERRNNNRLSNTIKNFNYELSLKSAL